MPLPETLEVRLSSEEAAAISITPVVVQQMTVFELFERIVSVTGKDLPRIQKILRSGTLLDSATRFRWAGMEAAADEIGAHLARFPDPDPSRPFASELCMEALLTDSIGRSLSFKKETASRKRLLRRRSFWDALIRLAAEGQLRYVTYSYRNEADCYRLAVSASGGAIIREAAGLLAHDFQARQLKAADLATVDFFVPRRA